MASRYQFEYKNPRTQACLHCFADEPVAEIPSAASQVPETNSTAVADPAAHIISIDMPYPWADREGVASSVERVRTMLRPSQKLTVIAADSHNVATLAGLRDTLAGALIDVLWIDGDHTYEGVRQDVRMYEELVRRGGIIALHDIRQSDLFPNQQSDVYWQELKAHARTRELVAEPSPGAGMGIGVIFVD